MSNVVRPNNAGFFPCLSTGVHDVALGNGTQYRMAVIKHPAFGERPKKVFVGVEGMGCYTFTEAFDSRYVMEKLLLKAMHGDALNISDFIRDQFEEGPTPYSFKRERFGHYNPKLCTP